jgi:hypothetical protein
MIESWNIGEQHSRGFVRAAEQAVINDLDNFRRDPEMNLVVENSNYPGALLDIAFINQHYHFLWEYRDRFRTSDTVGNPEVQYFEKIDNFSPSTIRYIKALGDLVRYFDALSQCHVIAEIGAGYGGFGKLIFDFCKPTIYELYDLEACMNLQVKFMGKFNIYPLKCSVDDHIAKNSIDLVIASCSWSELALPLRLKYLENVIVKAKMGYFILNYDTYENIKILEDRLPEKEFIRDPYNPCILIFR